MSEQEKKGFRFGKGAVAAGAFVLLAACAAFFGYQWFFCRFYVPAGCMAVVTAKTGDEAPAGAILVERGQKGIWRDVLAEGRHFLDPVSYDVRIVPATRIPLGKVGIVISKVGRELAPGEIIAPDHDSKGIWRDVLGPGVYRLNPEGYTIEIEDAINIPTGYVGVVTSQTGALPAAGGFAKAGEKGVYKDVLQPGLYYINKYAYQVNVIEIGMNQVTMTGGNKGQSVFSTKARLATSNVALQQMESNTLLNQMNQRQDMMSQQSARMFSSAAPVKAKKAPVMRKSKSPAPVKSMKPPFDMDRQANAEMMAEAAENADMAASAETKLYGVSKVVEFPSRDGFVVSLEMTVEFELLPEHISKIYLLYGDLPQVVEKIILPQVLSVSRMKGSSYGAQDFIMGEGRENFQKNLREELEKTLAAKNIIVHNAIIRTVDIPMDILQPIRAVSLAREQDLTNIAMQETAKKLGELNTETQLIEQRKREVQQETEKLVAMTSAESKMEVETIGAEAKRSIAEIGVKRSELQAKITALKGETAVKVKFMTENEEALGEVMRAKALGDGDVLCRLKAVEALNPKVETRIIHAGEGTLWTNLQNAAVALPNAVKK